MSESLLRGDSLVGVISAHLVYQFDALLRSVGQEFLHPGTLLRGKVEIDPAIAMLHFVEDGRVGSSQDIVDLRYLINFVCSREQRVEAHYFKKDAAHTPQVHPVGVVPVRQQAFRCPIPPRTDVLCVGLFAVHTSTGSEVGQF